MFGREVMYRDFLFYGITILLRKDISNSRATMGVPSYCVIAQEEGYSRE